MGNEVSRFGREMSVDDQLIMAAARGLSAEDIARQIGGVITPAKVIVRTRELLKAGDWLTDREAEQALLATLRNRVYELQAAKDLDSIKLQASLIKELLSSIEKQRARNATDLTTYSSNIGRQLGHVVDLVLTYMRGSMREEIDPEKWDAAILEAMVLAQNEIAKKQAVEA